MSSEDIKNLCYPEDLDFVKEKETEF